MEDMELQNPYTLESHLKKDMERKTFLAKV